MTHSAAFKLAARRLPDSLERAIAMLRAWDLECVEKGRQSSLFSRTVPGHLIVCTLQESRLELVVYTEAALLAWAVTTDLDAAGPRALAGGAGG